MCFGKFYELIYIRTNGLYPTLHGRYGIALTLQANALSHDGAKLTVSGVSRSAAVHTSQVAAKDEDLAWLKF